MDIGGWLISLFLDAGYKMSMWVKEQDNGEDERVRARGEGEDRKTKGRGEGGKGRGKE